MNGQLVFVGAGPGASDLITLRGAKYLAEADVVIYAGSLVNEQLLETAVHAEFFNSAKQSLPEVIARIERCYREGKKVVRLHTGDPSMYGAIAEQFRELDARGIPYEVVPGVSSVFASAAALKTELTMPGITQTVILTRDAGRTPVPPSENLETLASIGTTLCIFLSAGGISDVCEKLRSAGRPPDTPAAVVYRASWENQLIVRGTLSDLPEKASAAGIKRQAMIVVGQVLSGNGGLSKLYDSEFATGYRHHAYRGRKIALFALTRNAAVKASEIAAGLDSAKIFIPEKYASSVPELRRVPWKDGCFSETLRNAWHSFDALILVMASGIAVREIGGLCADKKTDPAVVLCDERGNYAVSLLSGHIGGANDLARDVARITGGRAVITTGSDVNEIPAVDAFAARCHYAIRNPDVLTSFAASVLDGSPVSAEMPEALFKKEFGSSPLFRLTKDRSDSTVLFHTEGRTVELRKKSLALGLGCRKGVSAERLAEVIFPLLEKEGIESSELSVLASAEVKSEEAGLSIFAERLGIPIRFFPAGDLNGFCVPNPSEAAERTFGIHSVSEASALLAAGTNAKLLIEKTAFGDVTVALAEGDPT